MQAYLSFFDKINNLVETASYETKFNLALDICKNLYPDYVSFATQHSFGDAALLQQAIDFCETSFLQQDSDNHATDEFIQKIESITPDSENFSSWDISYAANASQSVYELLMFLNDSHNQHISDICSLMIDTVDFKIAEANEHLSDDGIFKHPMMLEAMKEIIEKLK